MSLAGSSSRLLYLSAHISAIEHQATAQGISSTALMNRAGVASFDLLKARWPEVDAVHVLCGGGNNAGDGYVLAALAAKRAIPTYVWYLSDPVTLAGAAQKAYQYAIQEQVTVASFDEQAVMAVLSSGSVLVDALLGIGFKAPLREAYALAIHWLNQQVQPVLSLDIPSGINPDTGAGDVAVIANTTSTFIGQKVGLATGRGLACAGQISLATLGLPSDLLAQSDCRGQQIDGQALLAMLLDRQPDAHKGHSGHVMIIGGDSGTGGALLMASEMALYGGSGLVSAVTRPEHSTQLLIRRPEIMAHSVNSGQELLPLLKRASVLAIGPGLGTKAWGAQLCHHGLESQLPVIVDADGLNLFASHDSFTQPREKWVLTPHPGEAARLLSCTVSDIEHNRLAAALALNAKFGGVIVLKGAGTIVTDGHKIAINDTLAPALATGGMGDILTGLIAALYAQGLDLFDASALAVWLHSEAGRQLGDKLGVRGVLATEVIVAIREQLNGRCVYE